ncbi:uncharacterized protein MELLADRAFT_123878 [Melampsora larici-populina 98AG31]|uniref:Secreted protein n=1 Tax=Melampsora larici-populina (strain 98AG31 / pathotype 3-4-7) TaxID=747676 RepID=F4SAH0_MELLP|nr:uncharacterized protein MELLADRAFT_123878 [Melampsora larici-populina 98AG31]EGF98325.1 secreted protein [Melampsora larici-populina 98AG31]
MAYKRTNPIFFLALVLLIAGDFGSHIFADANSIECNVYWEGPASYNGNKNKCITVNGDGVKTTYICTACYRGDGKPASAKDCVGPHPLSSKGAFTCDAAMDENPTTSPKRPIFCFHYNAQHVRETYRCVSRHLNQQCPSEQCKVQGT